MPIVTASKVTMRTAAATTLLTSFMAWPVPTSPQWKTFGLMVSKMGLTRAYASAGAPTMMAMVPASAPCGPPLTGASISVMPDAARSLAISRVALGSPVVMSAMIAPFFRPDARPSLPKITSRTSLEVGRQVITRSLSLASASGLWLETPPSPASFTIASGRRS
jgi:hypothetical protein